ncbi:MULTISPECIES: PhoH family protein [unclassified Candidatus Frackibacter]|uniref:PhoH family protein n=1 Tax=unclassified Candidatus Frackibacter TaxID=2648818 RepID=UPI00088BDAB8|nr:MULTISPECIES: PhoH family protein [unclassified Candidatus Frackibacter]SDC74013.1 phosphate starvation-inducible protein PhoH [Candidatus Frackibacter sp. WG11]SEM88065.1 phosphate starvation-inducible protein PhoH [Candidatus Frackibacter sp. WG12]SFL97431.1 phosphate starvation-inducible protein PhoH [Candidatus Frackibacter sp. WG13]
MAVLIQEEIELVNNEVAMRIFGQRDRNLKLIEEEFDVEILARGNYLQIEGDDEREVEKVVKLFKELSKVVTNEHSLDEREMEYAIKLAVEDKFNLDRIYSDIVQVTHKGRKIKPKTIGQKVYIDAIRNQDIVFGIGPAGTGKTYLAVVMAVNALITNQVRRIILTRPAIEAGENLGFLPGDLQEKVDPYLRPLYDGLYEVLGPKKVDELLEQEIIEIAPLAYMRGRTLKDSFVILDEAQNTTSAQMKMFLTRLGVNSKAVINGDITQVDLSSRKTSGLNQVRKILAGISGIEFVYLTNKDVVRHRLVQKIIEAYESKV